MTERPSAVTIEATTQHPNPAGTVSITPGTAPVSIEPLTPRCHAIADTGEHACLGISPFNSYFTAERITALAAWALNTFASVHFYVPDGPAAYTLEAVGYSPERAAHKARRQGRWLGNKLRRTLADLGVPDPDPLVLDSAVLDTDTAYMRLHAEVSDRFAHDPDFASACQSASGWVLGQRLPAGASPTDDQMRAAVRYLLAELPLFTDTAAITGTAQSVFCYHQHVAFLNTLFRHQLTWKPAPRQGFLVVTLTEDSSSAPLNHLAEYAPTTEGKEVR
ncbi:tRNA-dependent cyclodipeptide synthase [Nocardia nova]|uniref:tRNA-dependent cyclodipeptide synthase n=1 Tax=Nocardia nova TaxID=37330 RepID=UPI0037A32F80